MQQGVSDINDMPNSPNPYDSSSSVRNLHHGDSLTELRRAVVCVAAITTILSIGCLISFGVGLWMSRQARASHYFDASSQVTFSRMALVGSGRQLLLSCALAHVAFRAWLYSRVLKSTNHDHAANEGQLARSQNACWHASAWLACLYLVSIIGVAVIGYIL